MAMGLFNQGHQTTIANVGSWHGFLGIWWVESVSQGTQRWFSAAANTRRRKLVEAGKGVAHGPLRIVIEGALGGSPDLPHARFDLSR